MDNHQNFLKAIAEKKIVKLRFNARQKGIIERSCIPYDFGPSKIFLSPNPSRYHFYDLDSPNGAHNLSIMIEQVILIEITEQNFDPANYIKWPPPYNWFITRDWGMYS